jgi:hypothetical protein
MKRMENLRLAFSALRQIDRRAQLILLVSLLLALGSMYMLLWSGVRGGGAVPSASQVYEPVDSIARFRGERERVRAVEAQQLNALIQDAAAGQDLKDRAREKLVLLTEWMEQETTVEGVLRAEGYVDPLVTVHADSVNVLVRLETLTQADAAKILSLAARETGEPGGNIKVIPVPSGGG